MAKIEPKFKMLQRVYHISKESEEGIIVDWVYRESTKLITYTVALGFGNEVYCVDWELSEERIYK